MENGGAVITTTRIVFRPVLPSDYGRLHKLESDPTTALTWRYRGQLPLITEYESALWKQTQQIMVVEGQTSGVVVGYLQLHDLDLRAGHGWFSLYSGPEHRGSGLVMEGLMAYCEWAFGNWPIRWLYAHSFAHNVHNFERGIRRGFAVKLGVLRERVIVDDILTDVHVIGIERENWLNSPLRRRFNRLRSSNS